MPQESFSSRWDAADAPLHPVGVPGSWSVWLGDWALPRTGYLSEKQCSSAAARASYLPPALLDLPVTCSAGREDAFQDIMTAPLSPFCPGCIFHFNCSAHLLLGQNPFPRVRSPWPGPLLLRATSSSLDKLVRVGSASLELDAGQEDTCMSRASPQKKCTRPVSHPSRLFPISPTSESRQLALDLIVWQPPRYPATFYRPSSRPTSTTAWLCSSNKRLAQRVSTVISLPANGSGTCRTAHRISTAQGTTSVSHRFWTDHCRPSLPCKSTPPSNLHAHAQKEANDSAFLRGLSSAHRCFRNSCLFIAAARPNKAALLSVLFRVLQAFLACCLARSREAARQGQSILLSLGM
ncbi:hypothetical protein VFPFJ_09345 [Purpureocillium lilacinum]|uniref:Uncharacterized protein n=1 Tax=Purpureocillium lilacinum TaxID=33203 RepID=A0A179GCQ1_PURLI|nr:hypothetical protein VFPFJ_09345 [Purpureocillium lilacinum]OAQ75260.1 hypothetical protein VFPBJ_09235 [Purpureocillium lilacinum]OAQ80892.1 hypothetical protein VFPFJ_09345 [Purpureocillium lilacinum]